MFIKLCIYIYILFINIIWYFKFQLYNLIIRINIILYYIIIEKHYFSILDEISFEEIWDEDDTETLGK